jgi:hypothetical protein
MGRSATRRVVADSHEPTVHGRFISLVPWLGCHRRLDFQPGAGAAGRSNEGVRPMKALVPLAAAAATLAAVVASPASASCGCVVHHHHYRHHVSYRYRYYRPGPRYAYYGGYPAYYGYYGYPAYYGYGYPAYYGYPRYYGWGGPTIGLSFGFGHHWR